MHGRRRNWEGGAAQGRRLEPWQRGANGDPGVCRGDAVGHTHTPEEGLGYDGGGMAHMQAQGGGLERPG